MTTVDGVSRYVLLSAGDADGATLTETEPEELADPEKLQDGERLGEVQIPKASQ